MGGRLRRPKLRWASPQDLWLWNFDNHPIFKIEILSREKIFSPQRRSKVVKFAKNYRLDALIVLARDEQFLYFPWKWSKGGAIRWFFPILGLDSEKANFQKTKVKSSPSLTWAWPSSAPACFSPSSTFLIEGVLRSKRWKRPCWPFWAP